MPTAAGRKARQRDGQPLAMPARRTWGRFDPSAGGCQFSTKASKPEALVLLSALAVALRLPARRQSATGPLRLRLPHVPVANRRQVLCGIATFGPGIAATSFVLALGPSLLARLLDVRSPLLAGGMACAMFFTAVGVQFAVRQWPVARIFATAPQPRCWRWRALRWPSTTPWGSLQAQRCSRWCWPSSRWAEAPGLCAAPGSRQP